MRAPSDAQAAVLSTIAEHEASGRELFWRPARSFRGCAALALEHVDRKANRGHWMLFSVASVKTRSLEACVRHEWVVTTHELVIASGLQMGGVVYSSRPPEPEILRQLSLTADGELALGLWRERTLHAPPAPTPTLTGRDRDVVELATRAAALGYRLAPREDPARRQARRLTREGWVTRGGLGLGTGTLAPTALGQVEVAPDSADRAATGGSVSQLELIAGTRRKPEDIVGEAFACEGCPVKTVCLLNGGGDSTVTAHRCRELYDELAFVDPGTALPGVREFVIEFADSLGKPLRIYDSGDAYRRLVLGDPAWWRFCGAERRRGESLAAFVVRTTPARRCGDGLGNVPQGFPGPGGHRAAYTTLKERQIEALLRDAKRGRGRHERVALLSGARRHESRRRSMTLGVDGFRRRKSQLWINPLNDWRDHGMAAYRRAHGIPTSDVAACCIGPASATAAGTWPPASWPTS